jgi:CheY-like chemotaxis protein
MALRVLLADESSTIKRVMQLALQDFGVEVKSVPVGLDVLAVTKTFKPDIIFADVLLAKRNGYDVCLELKSDPETRNTPVVLMWSGFMEVDEARITQAGPDGRLEKPFDSETLRHLVQQVVPKTQSNPVSAYLQFPKMPEFSEERPQPAATPAPTPAPAPLASASKPAPLAPAAPVQKPAGKIPDSAPLNFETLTTQAAQEDVFKIDPEASYSGMTSPRHDELPMIDNPEMDPESDLLVAMDEDFAAVPLQSAQRRDQLEEDGWTQQDLKKFKIQIPDESPEISENDFATRFVIPQDDVAHAHSEVEGEFEEVHFGEDLPAAPLHKTNPGFVPSAKAPKSPASRPSEPASAGDFNAEDPASMERVIRAEAREVIESICWKVIPEMVERIVREEINKILRETEKSL